MALDPSLEFSYALRRTSVDKRRLLLLPDGRPAIAAAATLHRALAAQISPECAALFARPSLTRDSRGRVRSITWYGPQGPTPRRLTHADQRERLRAEDFLRRSIDLLVPLLESQGISSLLGPALHLPSRDDILILGERPILTGWGTVPDHLRNDAEYAHCFAEVIGAITGIAPPRITETPDHPQPPAYTETSLSNETTPKSGETETHRAEAEPQSVAVLATAPPETQPLQDEDPPPLSSATKPPATPRDRRSNDEAAPAIPPIERHDAPESPGVPSKSTKNVGEQPHRDGGEGRHRLRKIDFVRTRVPRMRLSRLPGSVWAAGVLAAALVISYIPGVLHVRSEGGGADSSTEIAVAKLVNATLARQITATESLSATVCTVADDPLLESERNRILPLPASRLLIDELTLSERLNLHTAQIELVPALEDGTSRRLGSATIISETHALGPELEIRGPDARLRLSNGALHRIAHAQPLPGGITLLEMERPIEGVEALLAAEAPDWRTPIAVSYAPGLETLPFAVISPGVVASGAPGVAVQTTPSLAHTAPIAGAAGGGLYDSCGRLIAVAGNVDGAATRIKNVERALFAAGARIEFTGRECRPVRLPPEAGRGR